MGCLGLKRWAEQCPWVPGCVSCVREVDQSSQGVDWTQCAGSSLAGGGGVSEATPPALDQTLTSCSRRPVETFCSRQHMDSASVRSAKELPLNSGLVWLRLKRRTPSRDKLCVIEGQRLRQHHPSAPMLSRHMEGPQQTPRNSHVLSRGVFYLLFQPYKRYWHITLRTLKVYHIMIWYMCVMKWSPD